MIDPWIWWDIFITWNVTMTPGILLCCLVVWLQVRSELKRMK